MSRKILAVDDEPHMLKLLDRIITEKTDHQIVTTNNSLEVPQILESDEFDIIISDLKMPGMDGMDILKYLKDHDRNEKVIIMTAFASLDTALDALSMGVFDYITKPFKKEQIIATIEKAMLWQQFRRDSQTFLNILTQEPFTKALEYFKREYVLRLSLRYNFDFVEMSQVSGIPEEELKSILGAPN